MNFRRTQLIMVFASAFFLGGLSSCQKDIKSEPWYVFAQKYIEADEAIMRNEAEKKGTFLEDLVVRDDAASQLLKVPVPSIPKSDALLRSNNRAARKAVIVNIMLRQIKEGRLLESILETYRVEDDRSTKFYSVRCFIHLNDMQLKAFEDRLIKIFTLEKDEVVIIAAMPALTRLDKYKVRPLFTKYLRTGTDGLRAVAIVSLREINADLLNEIQQELKSEGIDMWSGLSKWRLPERLRSYEKDKKSGKLDRQEKK